jgi:hypothetical protein
MQIDEQVIQNMLITFIIHDYDVEFFKKQLCKNTNKKKHFSISFIFKTEINFSKMRWLVNSKLVYLIPTPMLSSLLEF